MSLTPKKERVYHDPDMEPATGNDTFWIYLSALSCFGGALFSMISSSSYDMEHFAVLAMTPIVGALIMMVFIHITKGGVS